MLNDGETRGPTMGAVGETDLELAQDEVHVWRFGLEPAPDDLARLQTLLSTDEIDRARRFRFERDRARYQAGRGVLRVILSSYLQVSPAALPFSYGEFGKPHLPGSGLHFNLSHSGATALLAVTRRAEVGVDLELEPVDFDVQELAGRFFSPGEVAELASVPAGERPRAFLHCWTRKEAFIKARGDGLQLALDSFDVSLKPALPAVLKRTAWDDEEPGQWTIRDVSDARQGYVGAVAIRATNVRVVNHPVPSMLDRWLTTQEAK
jgi:4'-phosphopantetheinyl transferase